MSQIKPTLKRQAISLEIKYEIQAQAIKYSTFLGLTEFKASPGWLDKFKKGIIFHSSLL